nr:immunoglobulin heavy chain junction region [Macaca mulatta]MOV36071.1 immunoglobulin heavy chain junction region [Macaca mulatta]MOV36123.1 immunoglobulin heavy chain junction region [Macaca mulatta]MOV36435.1 immunoglobulin heavy chain junction region [Macaca mulatta]MOV36592.1 immunoglobulin heavy chain junction region [Macaca mulatta]
CARRGVHYYGGDYDSLDVW